MNGEGSSQRLVTGYNHNIPYGAVIYHVQTEFFGNQPAHVDTHVFDKGRVVGSYRSDVDIDVEGADERVLHVMKAQQKEMIRRLISGRLNTPPAPKASGFSALPRPASAAIPQDEEIVSGGQSVANLELRRSLIRFVRAVRPEDRPEAKQILDRLRSVITTTAMILGCHVYGNSRQEELAELLILRSEGLDWLRGRDHEEAKGLLIWSAFARIALRFAQLNQRRDLVDHDRAVWGRVLCALENVPTTAKVEQDILESLKSTWGRVEELDALMEFPLGLDAGKLRRAIESSLRDLRSDSAAADAVSRREHSRV